ncbi:MAG: hypothetical protein QG597_331 [Actinomycetota bacterium]|nr:hypothetical protein [Actinomycetota bacterium]
MSTTDQTLAVTIRHQPAFAVARLTLAPGQRVRASSGALYMRDAAVTVDAKMEGGMKGAFKRAIGGQSFFTSTYVGASDRETWVDFTQVLPGELLTVDITPQRGLVLTQGNWLASTADIQLDTKWGGFKSLVGGERIFAVHLSGAGQALLCSYGAIDTFELAAGQEVVVDAGHLMGYDDSATVNVQTQGGGLMNSLKSGEMIVVKVAGPGRIWTQTRSERELAEWVRRQVPTQTSN